MAEARMIEMMARALFNAEYARDEPISDAVWSQIWDEPNSLRSLLTDKARAALSVLAANVSDEMVNAFSRVQPAHYFPLSKWGEDTREAIAAALTSAAGDEGRRAS